MLEDESPGQHRPLDGVPRALHAEHPRPELSEPVRREASSAADVYDALDPQGSEHEVEGVVREALLVEVGEAPEVSLVPATPVDASLDRPALLGRDGLRGHRRRRLKSEGPPLDGRDDLGGASERASGPEEARES